ncbi:MAG: hypothetical protein IPM36_19915 [Lewinellaceae bacterium]|nr:hypothetical protein [Lewinellaceae bacterium]
MKYTRLIELTNLQELTLVELALRKANINYRTLFENTLRAAGTLALGNNGAIIEVPEGDMNKSIQVLSELGIEIDYDSQKDRFEFIDNIDKATEKIPFIGKMSLGLRFLLLAALSTFILLAVVFFITTRVSKNDLVGDFWCVEEIIYKGQKLQPNTVTNVIITGFQEKCKEDILFHDTGMIALPGFGSYTTRGEWRFKTDKVFTISRVQDFKEIYEGEYTVHTNWDGSVDFVSNNTTIKISSRKY